MKLSQALTVKDKHIINGPPKYLLLLLQSVQTVRIIRLIWLCDGSSVLGMVVLRVTRHHTCTKTLQRLGALRIKACLPWSSVRVKCILVLGSIVMEKWIILNSACTYEFTFEEVTCTCRSSDCHHLHLHLWRSCQCLFTSLKNFWWRVCQFLTLLFLTTVDCGLH